VSFAAITHVASQLVFIVAVYFVIDSVQKLLNTPPYLVKGLEINSILLPFIP
jgi:mannose/fructose/N-acetylgalactosamine-specific phosphotransferase system component IIC